MNILHLIDVPWDSGLAHYALTLGVGQKDQGHRVFVSALPGEKPWKKAARLGLDTVPFVKLSKLNALRRFIHQEGIDILNAHTGSTHTLAVAAAWGHHAAVVRTRSDARPLRPRPGSSLLYRRTQRVIGAADYIRKDFLDTFHLPPEKVRTIYQGIQAPHVFPEETVTAPVIGIVARLDPVKGHRYLIQAIGELRARYPAIRLKIAGQEENIKPSELRALAQRYGVKDHVDFLGHVERVGELMRGCAVGVVASTGSEAVSRVALEWMAAGKPVVSTSVGCLPEMVKPNETGTLVPPQDATSLAHALEKLFKDPVQAHAMGKAGYTRVKHQFSLDQFIDQTMQVYREAKAALQ